MLETLQGYRRPKGMPPAFIPQKEQGQPIQQGPGPVVIGPNSGGPAKPWGPPNPGGSPKPGGPQPNKPGQGPNWPWQQGGYNPQWQNMANKIRPCRGQFTYLWLNNGSEFWFYIETITPRYVYGWRLRNGRWENGRIALDRIVSFYCNRRD